MSFNELLSNVIANRTIQAVSSAGGLLQITYNDGSIMQIKTGGPVPATDALLGRTVKTVHQSDAIMDMTFTNSSTGRIKLAEATSSVILRDKDGNLEYAD
jgi:hypothetical protein